MCVDSVSIEYVHVCGVCVCVCVCVSLYYCALQFLIVSMSRRSPSDFLKAVLGRPVLVKLNSGVEYRGITFSDTSYIAPLGNGMGDGDVEVEGMVMAMAMALITEITIFVQ